TAFNQSIPRINADSFEQIREGMTQAEVEAVLGAPPGDYRKADDVTREPTRKAWVNFHAQGMARLLSPDSPFRYESWYTTRAGILVYFRPDGTVADKEPLTFDPPP